MNENAQLNHVIELVMIHFGRLLTSPIVKVITKVGEEIIEVACEEFIDLEGGNGEKSNKAERSRFKFTSIFNTK